MNTPTVIEHEPQQQMVLRASSPMDVAPTEFKSALARRGENRKSLIEWIRSSLVDGVDFGAIQRRNGSMTKPSLRKPGAEKICGMLGVTAVFPTLKDYEAAALDGREIRNIILRCHILAADGQTVVADGVGARNLESDNGDLNKALKMALKSAHIDATLRMAGLSEIFTQDLEDMPPATFDGQNSNTPPRPLSPAQAFGKSLVEALEVGVEAKVVEIWDAGMKDKDTAQAAWELLTSEERKAINAILERAKGPPAKKGMTQSSKWA